MPKLPIHLAILGLGWLAFADASNATATPTTATPVIGSINEEIETFQPLADYLKAHVNEPEFHHVRGAVASTASEISRQPAVGEVDLDNENSFLVARTTREAGARGCVPPCGS